MTNNIVDDIQVKILHNGEFDTNVHIIVDASTVIHVLNEHKVEIQVPFLLIRRIVFEYLRQTAINEIRAMDDDDFQGIFLGI